MTQADLLEPGTDIVAIVEANPVMVLTDREKFNQFYEQIKRETDALEADVTTEKGRKAIKSMAFKVAQTKTAIDEAGKKLNEEARARINVVDESRREIKRQLTELQAEVRRPVTEWEEREEARVAECEAILASLRNVAVVPHGASAADVRERLSEVQAQLLVADVLQGFMPQAELLQQQAVATLAFMAEEIEQAEAERAELEKLRAKEAEREAREAAEREERDRLEAERIAAEQAEQRRKDAEEAEAARIRMAEERAAQAARDEELRKARDAEEAREREHQEQLAEERRQREEAERREKEREEQEARAAAERAKREADQAHRSAVMRRAKEAIMEFGPVDEATAKTLVLAIVAGSIPHVSLVF